MKKCKVRQEIVSTRLLHVRSGASGRLPRAGAVQCQEVLGMEGKERQSVENRVTA